MGEFPYLISPIDNYKQWFADNESRLLKATEHDVISLALFEVAGWDRETAGNLADRYSNAYGVMAEEAGVEDLSEFLMALAELPNVQSGTYRNEHFEIHVHDAGAMLFFTYWSVTDEGDTMTVYENGVAVSIQPTVNEEVKS